MIDLIQENELRLFENRSSNSNPLLLSSRQFQASFANQSVVA